MNKKINIETVFNGWIVTDNYGIKTVYTDSVAYLKAIVLITVDQDHYDIVITKFTNRNPPSQEEMDREAVS